MVIGSEQLDELFASRAYDVKMVFNDRGAIVFSARCQHRDAKAEGITYEDNYKGNALAAMVRRDAIEIRFHRSYDDEAVAQIVRRLLALPEFSALAQARITYQGRVISAS